MVIRYCYLWSEDHAQGRWDGDKDRPALVVSAATPSQGEWRVAVMPITHTPPATEARETSMEIPVAVKQRLALDDDGSWIRLDELNQFDWPGPDLRQIPGKPGVFHYGFVPPRFQDKVVERFRALAQSRRLHVVRREA